MHSFPVNFGHKKMAAKDNNINKGNWAVVLDGKLCPPIPQNTIPNSSATPGVDAREPKSTAVEVAAQSGAKLGCTGIS